MVMSCVGVDCVLFCLVVAPPCGYWIKSSMTDRSGNDGPGWDLQDVGASLGGLRIKPAMTHGRHARPSPCCGY